MRVVFFRYTTRPEYQLILLIVVRRSVLRAPSPPHHIYIYKYMQERPQAYPPFICGGPGHRMSPVRCRPVPRALLWAHDRGGECLRRWKEGLPNGQTKPTPPSLPLSTTGKEMAIMFSRVFTEHSCRNRQRSRWEIVWRDMGEEFM